jgi:hypothetical protein
MILKYVARLNDLLKAKAALYLSDIEGFPKRSDDVSQRAGMQGVHHSFHSPQQSITQPTTVGRCSPQPSHFVMIGLLASSLATSNLDRKG